MKNTRPTTSDENFLSVFFSKMLGAGFALAPGVIVNAYISTHYVPSEMSTLIQIIQWIAYISMIALPILAWRMIFPKKKMPPWLRM